MTRHAATTSPADRHASAKAALASVGQEQLLTFYDRLDDAQRDQLLSQIESIDWPEVARLVETHVKQKPGFDLSLDKLEPAPWYPHVPPHDLEQKYQQADELGERLLREGKVAAFTVAGGQGTRLGWDAPKGTFPATPIRGLSLFGCFAEYLHKIQQRYGPAVPWYVMTSPVNDADTRAFFEQQDYFDLDPANVMLFPQAMMPAIDSATGKALLAAPDSLALSPNGHGGSLKALWTSGAIDDMKHRGVTRISYIQVDNPIVKVIDPRFLGLHALDETQMSSKMLPKREPLEKLGNFCVVDGRMTVIEYSDLPNELAHQRDDEGQLRFLAGSIAIHVIDADFVESLNTSPGGFALPFHRADKKVPHMDLSTGERVEPVAANAVKLETFVFDALPLCEASIVYETSRSEEFAPIKNADGPGAVDCPATSRRVQIERAGRWLASHGVDIPRRPDGTVDATIEISQRTAIEPGDLDGMRLPERVSPGGSQLL